MSKPPLKGASRVDPYHARNTTPAFTVVRGPHRAAAALQITHTQRCGMAFNDFGWRIPGPAYPSADNSIQYIPESWQGGYCSAGLTSRRCPRSLRTASAPTLRAPDYAILRL